MAKRDRPKTEREKEIKMVMPDLLVRHSLGEDGIWYPDR